MDYLPEVVNVCESSLPSFSCTGVANFFVTISLMEELQIGVSSVPLVDTLKLRLDSSTSRFSNSHVLMDNVIFEVAKLSDMRMIPTDEAIFRPRGESHLIVLDTFDYDV